MALLNSGKKKGIFYIVCSAFFFALMLMFVRLSGDLPSMQKAFFRNFVAMFFALFILIKDKIKFSGKKENVKYLILRSLIGVGGIIGNFYAVDHLVLSDASILNKMSPFFAIVFSYFIVKEKKYKKLSAAKDLHLIQDLKESLTNKELVYTMFMFFTINYISYVI